VRIGPHGPKTILAVNRAGNSVTVRFSSSVGTAHRESEFCGGLAPHAPLVAPRLTVRLFDYCPSDSTFLLESESQSE
jgi:hypothetical protein